MSTTKFVAGALDESGCPVWISALAAEDPNHLVHVARDLEPASALELLGAERDSITSCELYDLAELDGDSSAEVRTAVELAGAFDTRFDDYLSMRAVCILAGLPRTLEDLRSVSLLVAPLD